MTASGYGFCFVGYRQKPFFSFSSGYPLYPPAAGAASIRQPFSHVTFINGYTQPDLHSPGYLFPLSSNQPIS
jgi:hypothetical protein